MVAFEHPHPHGTLAPTAHLELPFFDDAHRALANGLVAWAREQHVDETDDRAACRDWVQRLGAAGWLRYCVPAAHGGALPALDSRALVILRETLAFHSPLADFAFAMQGLGSGAITLAGTPAQQAAYLPAVACGEKIAAFALSEPEAGSDVAGMALRATPTAHGWQLDGQKTWISNGGMADFYVTFAKTDPEAGARGISAFIVDANAPGLDSRSHIQVMAPHPLATLTFRACTVRQDALVGSLNGGFKLAMQTLDIFRISIVMMSSAFLSDAALAQANAFRLASMVDQPSLRCYYFIILYIPVPHELHLPFMAERPPDPSPAVPPRDC